VVQDPLDDVRVLARAVSRHRFFTVNRGKRGRLSRIDPALAAVEKVGEEREVERRGRESGAVAAVLPVPSTGCDDGIPADGGRFRVVRLGWSEPWSEPVARRERRVLEEIEHLVAVRAADGEDDALEGFDESEGGLGIQRGETHAGAGRPGTPGDGGLSGSWAGVGCGHATSR
jgi:hypothetical protein